MGVWRSCECPGRLLKVENYFLLCLGMLSFIGGCLSSEITMAGICSYLS